MGAEFLKRAKPTIEKYVDRKLEELAEADLFTRLPTTSSRTALVSFSDNEVLTEGEIVVVEASDSGLIVLKNGIEIGRFINPPDQFVLGIEKSCGVARGEIVQYFRLSKTAEVCIS